MYERPVVPPEHVIPTDLSQSMEFAATGEVEDRAYMTEHATMTEHAIDDALPELHHRVEPRLEPAPEAMQDWARPAHALGLDPIEMPSAFGPEIRDHHRGDVLAHDDGQGLRVWLIAGALITTFSLGWAGGSNSDRILSLAVDTSAGTPPRMLGADKQTVVAKSDKFVSSTPSRAAPDLRKALTPPASMPENPRTTPVGAARPAAPSASLVSLIEQDSATSLGPATQHETKALTRLMPTPETRPPSLAGWTVRSVDGKTAVLEGPGGVWKAAAGDSVPGVGRVHSIVRWGNHWIVATSKGLITTR